MSDLIISGKDLKKKQQQKNSINPFVKHARENSWWPPPNRTLAESQGTKIK